MRSTPPPLTDDDTAMTPLLRPMARRAWRWLLGVLLVSILLLALVPVPPRNMDTGWDKLNHLLAFGSLALCACMTQVSWRQRWPWLIALLGYGAMIEVLQWFTPTRQAEWGDLGADAVGILLGTMLAAALLHALALSQARRATSAASRAKP